MTVPRSALSRRHALTGAVTAGVGLPLLAACGDDSPEGGSAASDPASTSSAPESSPTATRTKGGDGATSVPAEGIATAAVPVGGALIDGEVVVTQPTEGEFKAFSAICTHQGCPVDSVDDGFIVCPCHGSRFAIDTGEPTSDSLAPTALPALDLTVTGDRVVVG